MTMLLTIVSQPPDIWHDPNAIGLMSLGAAIIAIIVAIAIGIYQVRAGRTKRRLEYEIVSDAPIVTTNSIIRGKGNIEVLFNGLLIKHARVLVLKIKNTGNTSIRAEDYFEPLSLTFKAKLINVDILETHPANLIPSNSQKNFLTLDEQAIELPKFPLNKQESITISIMLEGKSALIVRGRLDQGLIYEHTSDARTFIDKYSPIMGIFLCLISVLGSASLLILQNDLIVIIIVAIGFISILAFFAIDMILKNKHKLRK